MSESIMARQSDKYLARVIACPNCSSSKILVSWAYHGMKHSMFGYCCNCKQYWSEKSEENE